MSDEEILDAIRGVRNNLATVDFTAVPSMVLCKSEDSQAVLKIVEDISYVQIPRKLAKTILGILESEYEGTEMFQDEINELKGLLESECSHEWEDWSVAPARHKGELAKWRHCKKCDKFDFRLEHKYE